MIASHSLLPLPFIYPLLVRTLFRIQIYSKIATRNPTARNSPPPVPRSSFRVRVIRAAVVDQSLISRVTEYLSSNMNLESAMSCTFRAWSRVGYTTGVGEDKETTPWRYIVIYRLISDTGRYNNDLKTPNNLRYRVLLTN